MQIPNLATAKGANGGAVMDCTRSETDFTSVKRIALILKAFWPVKTAANVAYVANVSERSVKHWLAGETRMSLENIVALLKTDAGFEILEAVLGKDCKAEWWVVTQSAQNIRKSRKAIKREQERIEQTRAQLDLLDEK
jgi:hypothetical protein